MAEKKIMKYSVLRYSPSRVAGEHINIGIIFDAPEDKYREFRFIKKFARLSSFDDELNIDNTKLLLKGIKEDVEGTIFTFDSFDIDKYVEFFINDFNFERPKQIGYNDLEEVLDTLHKSYFRFEYEKSQRPSAEDDKRMIYRILRDSGKSFERSISTKGIFDEKIKYDIVTEKYKVKIFDFDNKDLSKMINTAKAWAWNANHNFEKDILIIYRYSNADHRQEALFETIIKILKESGSEVLNIDAGVSKLIA